MKKWSSILSIVFLFSTLTVHANQNPLPSTTIARTDTLANRHPGLAAALTLAVRYQYQKSLSFEAQKTTGKGEKRKQIIAQNNALSILNGNLVDMFDFSLTLIAPSALGEIGAMGTAASLLIVSALPTSPLQALKENPLVLNPVLVGGAYSHVTNALHGKVKPHVETYLNQTILENHSNSVSLLAPAAAFGTSALTYYVAKGNFKGFAGNLAQGAAYKTAYILCDSFEKLNIEMLRNQVGDKAWIEPVAQLETGVLLAITSHSLTLLNMVIPTILSGLAMEVAGYEFANAGFTFVEKTAPEYAPYANPVIAATMLALLAPLSVRTQIATQPVAVKTAIGGASLAAFLQLASAFFNLPGWLEDEAYAAVTNFHRTLFAIR